MKVVCLWVRVFAVILTVLNSSSAQATTLDQVDAELRIFQNKFNLTDLEIHAWAQMYAEFPDKIDYSTVNQAIQSCSTFKKDEAVGCLNLNTQFTYAAAKYLTFAPKTKIASELHQSYNVLRSSPVIRPENIEFAFQYFAEAQKLDFLPPVSSSNDITLITYFFWQPPKALPKSLTDLRQALFFAQSRVPIQIVQPIAASPVKKEIEDQERRNPDEFHKQVYEYLTSWGTGDAGKFLSWSRLSHYNLSALIDEVNSRKSGWREYYKNTGLLVEFSDRVKQNGVQNFTYGKSLFLLFDRLGFKLNSSDIGNDLDDLVQSVDPETAELLLYKINTTSVEDGVVSPLVEELGRNADHSRVLSVSKFANAFARDLKFPTTALKRLKTIAQFHQAELQELVRTVPFLTLTHFSETPTSSPETLATSQEWIDKIKEQIKNHPEFLNPRVSVVSFELADGTWDERLKILEESLSDSDLQSRFRSSVKNWLITTLNSPIQAEKVRPLLTSISFGSKTLTPNEIRLARMIAQYPAPFLGAYLTEACAHQANLDGLPDSAEQVLKKAQELGKLDLQSCVGVENRRACEQKEVQEIISDSEFDHLVLPHLALNYSLEIEDQLRAYIKESILKDSDLKKALQGLLSQPQKVEATTLLELKNLPAYSIHYFLNSPHIILKNQDLLGVLRPLQQRAIQRNMVLGDSYFNKTVATALLTALEDETALAEFEQRLRQKTPFVPSDLKLYRWGERSFEKSRIKGPPFILKEGNYSGTAAGPGLYLAQGPLSSFSYGNTPDPFLIKVDLPPSTRLLDLGSSFSGNSAKSSKSPLETVFEELKQDPWIAKLNLSNTSDFSSFMLELGPKSFLIRYTNQWYVYKTSGSEEHETVSQPEFTLQDLEIAASSDSLSSSKDIQHNAASSHLWRRLFPRKLLSTPLPAPIRGYSDSSGAGLPELNYGQYFYTQDGKVTSIEVRDSVRERSAFSCRLNQAWDQNTIIVENRSLQWINRNDSYESAPRITVQVKSCAEFDGTEKAGFVCEKIEKSESALFIDIAQWAGDNSFDRSKLPKFDSRSECLQAGLKKNAFWRCLPDVRDGDHNGKFRFTLDGILNKSTLSSRTYGGPFDSLAACQEALDSMTLGQTCFSSEKVYHSTSLFDPELPSESFDSFAACSHELKQRQLKWFHEMRELSKSASPVEFIAKANEFPGLKVLMNSPHGEKGPVQGHLIQVLQSWDNLVQNKNYPLSNGISKLAEQNHLDHDRLLSLFRTVIGLHDLGKSILPAKRHYINVVLVRQALQGMGYAEREIELGLSLIDQDLLGNYLQKEAGRGNAKEFQYEFQSFARLLGVQPQAWMSIMIGFYTANSSYYPELKSTIFEDRSEDQSSPPKFKEPLIQGILEKLL